MMLSCYKALLFYIMCELICTYNTNAVFISLTLNTQQSMPKQMRFQWIHDNTNNKTALTLHSCCIVSVCVLQCSSPSAHVWTSQTRHIVAKFTWWGSTFLHMPHISQCQHLSVPRKSWPFLTKMMGIHMWQSTRQYLHSGLLGEILGHPHLTGQHHKCCNISTELVNQMWNN